MRGRDLAPPLVVAAVVIAFVGYLWFQGRAHTVEYVVTSGRVAYVEASSPTVPDSLREDAPADQMLMVDVTWEAEDAIAGGSYYVLVSTPPGWENYACEPECEWASTPDLERYAKELPLSTYPVGAKFAAEESGRVRVAFVPTSVDTEGQPAFQPAAWLVQTDGANVLKARLIS